MRLNGCRILFEWLLNGCWTLHWTGRPDRSPLHFRWHAFTVFGMAMFIGSCSDEPNWEQLPDRQRDDVQVRPEVKSDEEWEYSFSVNGLCGEGADSASIFMADWPDRVWVGNVFPEADFGAGFENNIPYPEMSLTLRTDFPQPYVGHCISNGRQSMNYRRYLKSLIHSEEYKDFVRTDSLGGSVEVFYSEYNSPEGTKNIQVVKSRMLVLVLSRRFKVTMDIPDNVSFWEVPCQSRDFWFLLWQKLLNLAP